MRSIEVRRRTDVRRAGVLYACKGAPGSAKAISAPCGHRSERERERERDKEREGEREREREREREEKEINRKMMAALKE